VVTQRKTFNYEHQGHAVHGPWQEGGYSEKEPKRGEYSTISRNNIVWTNSKEIKDFIKKKTSEIECLIRNFFQIPLRTPQRPQPVFNPNRVCVHFTFCCHKAKQFACPIHTYVEACGSNTLLGSVVQLYSHNVIQSVYSCMAFFCY
jgi:hypothetical protein